MAGNLETRAEGFAVEDRVAKLLSARPGWVYVPWNTDGDSGFWEFVPSERKLAEPGVPTTLMLTDRHPGWLDVYRVHAGADPGPGGRAAGSPTCARTSPTWSPCRPPRLARVDTPPDLTATTGRRTVVSFVNRGGRMTVGQTRAWDRLWPALGRDVAALPAGPLDVDGWFGRPAPTMLEIGPGMGETTAALAAGRARSSTTWPSRCSRPASRS